MIIDCHGHYTTAPGQLVAWRNTQIDAKGDRSRIAEPDGPVISDDEIRESLLGAQIRTQRERGIDLTLFSPRAAAMGQHIGDEAMSRHWSRICNDLIRRICDLFPDHFAPVCQLPQSPGRKPERVVPELRRCVEEMGFVGCNLNPDPAGGYWTDPPMTDPWWFPLYEVLEDLDVPAMIHVSGSCNPNFQYSGAHYINADTSVFMQILDSDLFDRFPRLKFIIPHGGGAVPFHWGRYRGLAMDRGRKEPALMMGQNMFFDTCVYHQPGINLMTEVVPVDNVLFASETYGAVRAVDPETGHQFDDTKRYIEASPHLTDADRAKIFDGNARRVFTRLKLPD
ncbi:amidohydrolase family protein [Chelativorans salis]|uniref:Amidohydrolase n=1 Tax=Chelativorans salis TaxID=2978478 RepID=A0ABT2LQ51_9HYPH|nr:amidohydrolase family protein [Chelativorans sp. EGI FJ00035]MCT7376687.1 amidohydrolase [Chelativorans sp. EGI FJ00035]